MQWGQSFYVWQTLWINQNGRLKQKTSFQLPKVQNQLNRSIDQLIDNPYNFYKDVEVGDQDTYGWLCIEIIQLMTLADNPDIGIQYLSDTYNKAVYYRLLRRLRQRDYRFRQKKPQW